MANKCMYCKCEIDHDSSIDVCNACGAGAWGSKMFDAIKINMPAENPPQLFITFQESEDKI